jgi:hypothetical protein
MWHISQDSSTDNDAEGKKSGPAPVSVTHQCFPWRRKAFCSDFYLASA